MRKISSFTLFAAVCSISLVVCGASFESAQTPPSSAGLSGATYSELLPEQKALVDNWFRRFGEVVKKTVSAEEGYNNLPISAKTTFSAVTHALIHTPLTDQAGTSMGASAITLIEQLDTVAGKIEGGDSDKQFRIYVVLKPNAMDILARSQQFLRGPDNAVYHKGFPICYRGTNGIPSIQFSTTKDGRRADIDVDYRSGKFPASLVNGHLTAANSDIRSGSNDVLHNQNWSGFSNWWRGFLGLPILSKSTAESGNWPTNQPAVKASAKPEIAVRDFLKSWLVDQRPDLAAPYFAESAFRCRELEDASHVDLGMAKISTLIALRDVSLRIGKVAQLSDAIAGVRLSGPRGKVIPQPYESEFVLYDVREDLAEQLKCLNQIDPSNISEKAAKSKAFGKYVGSVFKFKVAGQAEAIEALWIKQDGYWRLISYDIEPEFERYRVPDTTTAAAAAAAAATPALTYVAGDKDLTQKAEDFLNKWFMLRQPSEALKYLSPQAYRCANLYRDEDTPAPSTPEAAAKLIQAGLERVVASVGTIKRLEDAIVAPEVSHPDIRLVKHNHSSAFVLASVPDHMAASAECQERKPGQEFYFQEPGTGKVYGNFYAVGFHLAKTVGDPSILWIMWAKENGQWKIVSYFLMTP